MYIKGVGMTRFDASSKSSIQLAYEAVFDALQDAQLTIKDMDAVVHEMKTDPSKIVAPSGAIQIEDERLADSSEEELADDIAVGEQEPDEDEL